MKKFLDLFKLKKSKVVEELTKDFDKKVETQKKVNEEYSKNKINHDLIFKSLMHDDFYHEINDLMAHFDKQLNPLHKGDKCGFRVDKSIYELTFHNGGYTCERKVLSLTNNEKKYWSWINNLDFFI